MISARVRQPVILRAAARLLCCALFFLSIPARAEMTEYPVVRLQSLDKASARTMTFEVRVGSTVKFGPIYIKVQACRKAPPIDPPEAASFLQIWEVTPKGESKWIYSGWMFASSPALSPMDHPIYDVWVLDCLERKSTDPAPAAQKEPAPDQAATDGEVSGAEAEPPAAAPAEQNSARPAPSGPKVTLPGETPDESGPTVTLPGAE